MQAIELVRRNVLTEMDGRDLARLIALEEQRDVYEDYSSSCSSGSSCDEKKSCVRRSKNRVVQRYQGYTVSMEEGGDIYLKNRHYTGNFNRGTGFVSRMMEHFEEHRNLEDKYQHTNDDDVDKEEKNHKKSTIKFKKIILDYFWIPKGSWSMTHWRKSFFSETLPSFAKAGTFCPISVHANAAAVYLPFCLRCLSQVFANLHILRCYYSISFLRKDSLQEVELWNATQQIDATEMQNWLGASWNIR